jgi:tRNA 2-thiouridine synthesizing protein C
MDDVTGSGAANARKSVLFVFMSSPQHGTCARDGIDALLAYAAFEQPAGVLFMDEGVWQLLPAQMPELAGRKSVAKSLAALPMYDVNEVFVHRPSVERRGIGCDGLAINATFIDDEQMRSLLRTYSVVMRF